MRILQTIDLKKYYGTKPNITRALDGVNFSVNDGEFVAVVGTSGSGKSTLLHMMGGLDTPTSGTVIVRGEELAKKNDEQLTIFRRRDRRPLQLCAVKISRFYGLRIIAFRNGCGVPSRDGLDQNVAAEHILVGTPECFFIVRIVPPERLEDRLAPHITFVGAPIDHGQQAIAQLIILPHDPERFLVVCPRVAIAFDGVRTMRAEHGRKRAELHPTEEHLFIGIADMPAAVRIAIRHAVVGRSEHGRDLLRKRIGIAQDIPRPLNGIAMARAVAYPLIASVGDIHHIAHDHGAAINPAVRLLLIKVLGNF